MRLSWVVSMQRGDHIAFEFVDVLQRHHSLFVIICVLERVYFPKRSGRRVFSQNGSKSLTNETQQMERNPETSRTLILA